jgi:predicted nucleic acid-binding protein
LSPAATILAWDLGAGESQVIAHCLEKGRRAVLDDGNARACALSHSIPIIGTLGIVLRAKKQGLIPAARPVIEQVRTAGSFLDDELVEQALAQIGE